MTCTIQVTGYKPDPDISSACEVVGPVFQIFTPNTVLGTGAVNATAAMREAVCDSIIDGLTNVTFAVEASEVALSQVTGLKIDNPVYVTHETCCP